METQRHHGPDLYRGANRLETDNSARSAVDSVGLHRLGGPAGDSLRGLCPLDEWSAMRDSFLDPPKRKQNRLRGYDYGRAGYYFITVCANQRAELFWEASSMRSVGADIIRPFSPNLSQYGCFVEEAIQNIPRCYADAVVDKYVVMPNHVHMILSLTCRSGRMISAPDRKSVV